MPPAGKSPRGILGCMGRMQIIHVPLWQGEAGEVGAAGGDPGDEPLRPALPLLEDDLNVSLGQTFRKRLLRTPAWFQMELSLGPAPLVRLEWTALADTAGFVRLRGAGEAPQVTAVLVNDLEDPAERVMLAETLPVFAPYWERLWAQKGPTVLAGYASPAWLQSRPAMTVLGSLANAFFSQFGVSD